MGSRNDKAKPRSSDQVVPSRPQGVAACGRNELRAAVAREFSLMEQAHDQIRAHELLARLAETTLTN